MEGKKKSHSSEVLLLCYIFCLENASYRLFFISDEGGKNRKEKKIYFCALDELIGRFTQIGHNIKTTGVMERRH